MMRRVVSESSTTIIRRSMGASRNRFIARIAWRRNTRIRVIPDLTAVRLLEGAWNTPGNYIQTLSNHVFAASSLLSSASANAEFRPIYIDYCRWSLTSLWYEFQSSENGTTVIAAVPVSKTTVKSV